ncbi:MAG: hypothetical protein VX951_14240 [Planctomycetota bacterium]|nr:hypothetical protein [Planctomycetota bacterium]
MTPALLRLAATPLVGLALLADLSAQPDPKKQPIPLGTVEGTAVREQMWRAPTAEEWKKPVLITWQRTWEDAVLLSKETGKPILICTNMDGEIASEHYAGVRYRQPEVAKIYEPYVCVMASVYRHNSRDYDKRGRRIECPRFGSITCGEHMWIEPALFKKYFENDRVAPRHIMIELDGKETYDLYYAFDTRSVFNQVQKGIIERRKDLTRQIRERSLVEKVVSNDHRDKVLVEKAYLGGDKNARRQLLQAVVARPQGAQADLLRLAVYDLDVELNKLARQALAKTDSAVAIDVINEALRAPMEDSERRDLVAALRRLAKYHSRASTLAAVHSGLSGRSAHVDAKAWDEALATSKAGAPRELVAIESQLEYRAAATRSRPKNANSHLELAEASLELAVNPQTSKMLSRDYRTAPKYTQLMFDDARRAARTAEKLGAKGWRVDSILAICDYYLGATERAHQRVEIAVRAVPKGDTGWNSMAVLGIFAEARMQAIRLAIKEKKKWPREWLTDLHATYSVLSKHPRGTDSQVVMHYDFLLYLGAKRQGGRALRAGVKRFPDSGRLHDRMRGRLLADGGIDGLERYYAARLKSADATPNLTWFAGYASIVVAEFRRRAGENDLALEAYDLAITRFDQAIVKNPKSRSTADHFAAIAMAGKARVAMEQSRYDRSVADLLASFARKPSAGGSLDGLNQTPMDTAKLLRSRLLAGQRSEQLARLDAAIGKLPPIALELPDYEKRAQADGLRVFRSGKMRRPGWRDRLKRR